MTTALRAIETVYAGCRFRSRIEARHAVFLSALKIPWRYELEGFDLGTHGYYLPDFWLPDQSAWLEIKPPRAYEVDPDGMRRFDRFAMSLVESGDESKRVFLASDKDLTIYAPFWEPGFRWAMCDSCSRVDIVDADGDPRCSHCPGHWSTSHAMIEAAYRTATGARFEHGERP